jgi:glyoxylase-like metal-dependent hydrolase (beta-lactamase superfamily II)
MTNIDEIEAGIFRINTPVPEMPGGFSFNQYLVMDDEPLLFHTGPRALFPLVSQAIAKVVPVASLRWLAFSHFEADECGALNELLAQAPQATAVCSMVGAMVSVGDFAIRAPRGMKGARDGEPCAGWTRRTCHTAGTAVTSSTKAAGHCCVAICSPSRAPRRPP